MAIYDKFVNATIVRLERPTTSGIGGKVATTTLLQTNIRANRQPFNAFATAGDFMIRDDDSALARADNTFWIDLEDASDLVVWAKPGDLIVWTSSRTSGPVSNTLKDEIVRVNVWDQPGLTREHVEIVVRGKAG